MHGNVCVCVLVRGSAAQTEGTLRGLGIWRVEVHLTGHFGGLGYGLVYVGRAIHGALCVGATALVLGRVAATAAALAGVGAGAVSITGVGP